MIINGSDATVFRGPSEVSSLALSSTQYLYSYETGAPLLNKTLVVSIENSSGSFYVYGVNASDLMVMKEFPVSGNFEAMNLVNVANSTNYTGDLLFSAGSTVYFISGTSIVYSEFPSQVMLVIVILTLSISVVISKRHRSRIK
jgi:hypothetical protein